MMVIELMFLAQITLGEAKFGTAKAEADKQESMLSASESSQLIESQGKAIGLAFSACEARKPIAPFTVVLALSYTGKVHKTWRNGGGEFGRCVEQRLAQVTFFNPPNDPFYTSLTFSFKP